MRKTAAVCVAKLYDINAELVEDQGFLQILRDLICDPNPTVRSEASAPVRLSVHPSFRVSAHPLILSTSSPSSQSKG